VTCEREEDCIDDPRLAAGLRPGVALTEHARVQHRAAMLHAYRGAPCGDPQQESAADPARHVVRARHLGAEAVLSDTDEVTSARAVRALEQMTALRLLTALEEPSEAHGT
jgi:hypothetical protein